jgi:fido (protein-threonine AMPylation protein)
VKWDNPDTYCYRGTSVLRNHLNLTDASELAAAEQLIVGLRSDQLFARLPSAPHNLDCLLGCTELCLENFIHSLESFALIPEE